jgi:two-component system sensor histidine kinase KdpD
MICISPTRPSLRLIRRGWRIAQRMHAEVIVVTVEERALNDKEKKIVQDDFSLAQRLSIDTVVLKGAPAPELIKYAKENSITHVVIGHSDRTRIQEVMQGSILSALTRELRTIDILVVAADMED